MPPCDLRVGVHSPTESVTRPAVLRIFSLAHQPAGLRARFKRLLVSVEAEITTHLTTMYARKAASTTDRLLPPEVSDLPPLSLFALPTVVSTCCYPFGMDACEIVLP